MEKRKLVLLIAGLVILMCVIVNLIQRQAIRDQATETVHTDSIIDSLETVNRELGSRLDELTVRMESIQSSPDSANNDAE